MTYWQGTHELAPLTVKEAAAQIGVSVRTLQRWCKAGIVGCTYLNGRMYFSQSSVNSFLSGTFNDKARQIGTKCDTRS